MAEPRTDKVARIAAAALAALAANVALFTGTAAASTAIETFTAVPSTTQAGGHPDVEIRMAWGTRATAPGDSSCHGCDDPRITVTHFPTGFIGNPHAVSICTFVQFSLKDCPPSSQVGLLAIPIAGSFPLYNLETHPDQAGLVGAIAPVIESPIFLDLSARTGSDYGLDSTSSPIFHLFNIPEIIVKLWGVPADPSHDALRFKTPLVNYETGAKSDIPPMPYLENPTSCGVPLSSGLDLTYYSGVSLHTDSPWPATTGCELLTFNPSLTASPTTAQADTASGLDVNLSVPQPQNPYTPSPSEIRATTITLPAGFSLTPNGSDGKVACTEAEASFGSKEAAHCPEFAKIGTDQIDSSALPGPISGGIYIGQPQPGQTFRLILTADGFGTHIKLLGNTHPDPKTGQITTVFENLPQSPFQEFSLHFFGSERGIYATPTQCGTYAVQTEFVAWDSVITNQHSTEYFTIDSGPNGGPCPNGPRPFNPRLEAGTVNATAGMHSPFTFELTRQDGDQNLAALSVITPPGFSATLKGIPYCPQAALDQLAKPSYSGIAEQASPACPAASQIGTAITGAGAGTHPLYNPGNVYLAGPYKGAPLSLVVVVPAVSGPYDLGIVAVRAAIHVDPATAQVTATSDPLPQITEGVPVRTRSIRLNLDRPNFTLNPTNCEPFSVSGALSGDEGGQANLAFPFQVANCANLGFAPKLRLRLLGGTHRNGHPTLRAALEARPGDANIAFAQLTLPHSELLDQSHINNDCTKVDFAANRCPPGSIYGYAEATSPLLEAPLKGPVYLRSSSHNLPDLVADLNGQVHIVLAARIDSIKGGIRATFETLPDVPVTTFRLSMQGGKKGLLANSEDVCKANLHAVARFSGQNGMQLDQRPLLGAACGKARHRRHLQGARAVR